MRPHTQITHAITGYYQLTVSEDWQRTIVASCLGKCHRVNHHNATLHCRVTSYWLSETQVIDYLAEAYNCVPATKVLATLATEGRKFNRF